MGTDLVGEPWNPLEDATTYADPKTRNRVLSANCIDQPPQARRIRCRSRKTHQKGRPSPRDLGEQVV
jgi:hypothetical protein